MTAALTTRERIAQECAQPGGGTRVAIAARLGISEAYVHSSLRALRAQKRIVPGRLEDGRRYWHTPDTAPAEYAVDSGAALPGRGGMIVEGSTQCRLLRALAAAGDAGMSRQDAWAALGITAAQLRRVLLSIRGITVWEAAVPGSIVPRMFGTPEAAAKWRRAQAHEAGKLSPSERKALTVKCRRKAGTDAAKAAGLAAPVVLRHDPRRKVADTAPIFTGRERVTVAKHQPDPRFYVDPATVPPLFSALPIGRYLEA